MLQRFNYLAGMFSSAALARPEIAPEFNYPVGDLAAGLSAAAQAIARILALSGLEAAYFPYIPGLTQPFVGTTNASSWPDSSGKARNLPQASGAKQPLILPNGTLRFDGITQSMVLAFSGLESQPVTRIIRLKPLAVGGASNGYILDGAGINNCALYLPATSLGSRAYAGTDLPGPVLVIGTYITIAIVYNGASSFVRANGVTFSGPIGANPGLGVSIGDSGGVTNQNSNMEAAMHTHLSQAMTVPQVDAAIADFNTICTGIT